MISLLQKIVLIVLAVTSLLQLSDAAPSIPDFVNVDAVDEKDRLLQMLTNIIIAHAKTHPRVQVQPTSPIDGHQLIRNNEIMYSRMARCYWYYPDNMSGYGEPVFNGTDLSDLARYRGSIHRACLSITWNFKVYAFVYYSYYRAYVYFQYPYEDPYIYQYMMSTHAAHDELLERTHCRDPRFQHDLTYISLAIEQMEYCVMSSEDECSMFKPPIHRSLKYVPTYTRDLNTGHAILDRIQRESKERIAKWRESVESGNPVEPE